MSNQIPTLPYDQPPKVHRKESRAVLPGYCAGVLLMGVVYDAISYPLCLHYFKDGFEQILFGLVLPFSFAFVSLLPQVLFLGISLWVKRKAAKDASLAGFRPAFLWGLASGVFPWGLFPVTQELGHEIPPLLYLVMLGWFVTFPTIAGLFLCRYSPLRG